MPFRCKDRNGTAATNTSDYAPFMYAAETNRLLDAHVAAPGPAGGAPAPLFLYLAHQNTHEPVDCPAAYEALFEDVEPGCKEPSPLLPGQHTCLRRTFCGMVLALDDAVKMVTSHMESLGLWENTLFIFQTDNGGNLGAAGNNHPLRGGKYNLFEGGTRGTAFIAGPVVPAAVRGTTSAVLMHEVDWMPTILGTHPAGGVAPAS